MPLSQVATQVKHMNMCSKHETAGAELVWAILFFLQFSIVLVLKQLYKAKTSILCYPHLRCIRTPSNDYNLKMWLK